MKSMGRLRRWFRIAAIVELVVGLALVGHGLRDESVLRWMWVMIGATMVTFGGIMLIVAGLLGRLAPVEIRNPVPATARVLSVRDKNITVNHTQGMFEVTAEIIHPDRAPYEARFTIGVGRTQWGRLVPGLIVPVLVERRDPMRIAPDPSRPVGAAPVPTGVGHQVIPGAVPFGGAGAGVPPVMSASDLIATGVAAFAVVEAVAPTGATAGQFTSGLAPHEADDPVVRIVLAFDGPHGQVRTHVAQRIPDGLGPFVVAGATLPVRYSAAAPEIATIDWARL